MLAQPMAKSDCGDVATAALSELCCRIWHEEAGLKG
jgi:hypothetical protein